MENQHRMIKGYRDLNAADLAMMNKIKEHAENTRLLIEEVRAHISAQYSAIEPSVVLDGAQNFEDSLPVRTPAHEAEYQRMTAAEPFLHTCNAKNQLQAGFMLLTRAVAQPTTF